MYKIENNWLGWKSDGYYSYLQAIAHKIPDLFLRFKYVWLSCIDSDRSINRNIPSIIRLGIHVPFREDLAIVIPGETILQMASEHNYFNGFDEAWFFQNNPPSTLYQPDSLHCNKWIDRLSSGTLREDSDLYSIFTWMRTTQAVLGLSDGLDLHYITADETIARKLDNEFCKSST